MLDNLHHMTNSLTHRGPNDSGYWLDSDVGIALGHRRLAILDLSAEGHQPMVSSDQRYYLVLDGKIYNHLALRRQLMKAGYTSWRGTSDAETLLGAIMQWGIRRALQACIGMFALAIWDKYTHRLTLARDRMGEKPLYYGWVGKHFLFGSELKALRAHSDWTAEINREAVANQLRLGYIPAPQTIYRNIYKIAAGHMLQITPHHRPSNEPRLEAYWSLSEQVAATTEHTIRTDAEYVHALEALLRHSVRQQMQTDVPIGALLSGGVDSALIVALMQSQANRPVKTFTIGYENTTFSEAPHARAIATHLGTEHIEFIATSQDIIDIIPQLPQLFDEPFSDIAQIPNILAAQLAKTCITVGLCGDGADELFGGYKRYAYIQQAWKHLHHLPHFMRGGLAGTLNHWNVPAWDKLIQPFSGLIPQRLRITEPKEKLRKIAGLLSAKTPDDIYSRLLSHWQHPEDLVLGVQCAPSAIPNHLPNGLNIAERMMFLDSVTYIPGNMLTRLDRSSMSIGLEMRTPFLDQRIVEMAWQLPLHLKIQQGQSKWILRQILQHYVPPHLNARPKQHWGMPLAGWLRTSLREWAHYLLNPTRLQQQGLLDPEPIQQKWHEHLTGAHNWQDCLWDVLMFQAWYEQQQAGVRHTIAA